MTDNLFSQFRDFVLYDASSNADVAQALVAADFFLERGELRLAASAYDRAYGLNPQDDSIRRLRGDILNQLAVEEHGIQFRYVPAGSFLMGSENGDPDERPVHQLSLPDYWVADIPVTWSVFADLSGFSAPPEAYPVVQPDDQMTLFGLGQKNKIRVQYCETETQQAGDWHAHVPDQIWQSGGQTITSEEMFGRVPRENPSRPFEYNVKPMVAVSWQESNELCELLSTDSVKYHVPSEAQWEKAARGGLIGQSYSWGSELPDRKFCDFGHFGDWVIQNPLTFAPNGYGVHAMCGGVWEWTQDHYDAMAYSLPPETRNESTEESSASFSSGIVSRLANFVRRSSSPQNEEQPERVLRGGSWADCAEAVTVSFRMSRSSAHWKDANFCDSTTPTVGFRMFRSEIA